ncbi:MAG TPA: dTDP-4-amino-4,6-dideoxygalactose transaminase [Anaerolineae bacterium]|nr:dTDP-4-amino-4,6-dideoxygalactose transaminase [Anaerolineae bacterium]
MSDFIPLTKPYMTEDEARAATDAILRGEVGGGGAASRRVEAKLEQRFEVKHALLVPSCTHAMELSFMAMDLQPGDQVIMPSFTFTSTANAILRQGGIPVFAEIEEETFNLDIEDAASRITPRTRAIMPVHYAGVGCRMDRVLDLAKSYNLKIVEDAAQGVGAKYNGKYLGTIGDAGAYSFHVTKNVTCGEGGAFLTNDDDLALRAEIIHEKGTNRAQYLRGQVDKYTWVDIGSSFVLSDLLAAILEKQLDKLDEINARRAEIWARFQAGFASLEASGRLKRPVIDPAAESNWHIYALRVALADRDPLIDTLRARGIGATFHYIPLHSSPFGRDHLGYRGDELPVTERAARSLVRLPLYPDLTSSQIEYIIENVNDYFRNH